jgi:hypothetical protein
MLLANTSAGTLNAPTASEASTHSITAKACRPPKRPPPKPSPRPPSPPPAQKTYAIDMAFRYVGNECPNQAKLHQYVQQLLVAVDPSANTIVTSSCVQNNSAVPITPANSLLLTQLNASNNAVPGGLNTVVPSASKQKPKSGVIIAKAVPVYCTPIFLSQVHQVQVSIRLAVPNITQASTRTAAAPPVGRASRSKPPPPKQAKRQVAKHTPPPAKKALAAGAFRTAGPSRIAPPPPSRTRTGSRGPATASPVVKPAQADPTLQPFLDSIRSLCLVQLTAASGAYVEYGIDTTTGLSLQPCTATLQLPSLPPAVACAPPSPPPLPPR